MALVEEALQEPCTAMVAVNNTRSLGVPAGHTAAVDDGDVAAVELDAGESTVAADDDDKLQEQDQV